MRRAGVGMSDPPGTMRDMAEFFITATQFRKHIAGISHSVAHRQDRYVVTWHRRMHIVVISEEEHRFLRKHRPHRIGPLPATSADTAKWLPLEPRQPEVAEALPDPFNMPIEDVQRHYDAFKSLPLELQPLDWLGRAALRLAIRFTQTMATGPPA